MKKIYNLNDPDIVFYSDQVEEARIYWINDVDTTVYGECSSLEDIAAIFNSLYSGYAMGKLVVEEVK